MTIKEYVELLISELEEEKVLTFEKADEFTSRISMLKYPGGLAISKDDQLKIVNLLHSELISRGFGIATFFRDSANDNVISAISKMLNAIKNKKEQDEKNND